jgi:DNA-binding NtrC family response regulator
MSNTDNSEASIIIIDDEPQMLTMLQRILASKGLKSVTYPSAKEALSVLRTNSTIKLALLDINMPEMTGLELLEQIQKITPSLNVIMITGMGDMEVAQRCMELGARDFITKPFDLEYLETSVMTQIIPLL